MLYLLLTFLWAGLIFYGSTLPGSDLPTAPDVTNYLAHFFEYAVLGGLVGLSILRLKQKLNPRLLSLGFLLALLYAVTDELHQFYVPGRNFDLWDLLVDAVGLLTALYMVYFFKYERG